MIMSDLWVITNNTTAFFTTRQEAIDYFYDNESEVVFYSIPAF